MLLDWAKRLLLVYILLSPYYLFPSGGLQISTIPLVAAILLTLIHTATHHTNHRQFLTLIKQNKFLLIFVTLAFAINTIYFLILSDQKFLYSSAYLILNTALVITFLVLTKKTDQRFLKNIAATLQINILLQLLITLTPLARYHPTDTYRLMGTFNDPNQLAFHIFASSLIIFIITHILHQKPKPHHIITWLTAITLIYLSASTGVLIGLTAFIALLLITLAIKHLKRSLLIPLFIAPILLATAFIITLNIPNFWQDVPIIQRIADKIIQQDGRNLLEDRGLDTITHYPEYLLFGAGEGSYNRFPEQVNGGNEIHSTLPALVFYYGLLPTLLLLKWLYDTTKHAPWPTKIALLALLTESLTLINYRQPLLWLIILLAQVTISQTTPPSTHKKKTLLPTTSRKT